MLREPRKSKESFVSAQATFSAEVLGRLWHAVACCGMLFVGCMCTQLGDMVSCQSSPFCWPLNEIVFCQLHQLATFS